MDNKDTEFKHIAVAGNIGSGKTTLTTLLSKNFGWDAHYEDIENNPYLNDFIRICRAGALTFKYTFLIRDLRK